MRIAAITSFCMLLMVIAFGLSGCPGGKTAEQTLVQTKDLACDAITSYVACTANTDCRWYGQQPENDKGCGAKDCYQFNNDENACGEYGCEWSDFDSTFGSGTCS